MVITIDELTIIAGSKGFDIAIIEKDYLLTYLLYTIKDVEGIYFKGGTALNKIFLKHQRISEDLDFTLSRSLPSVEKDIRDRLKGTIFSNIEEGNKVEGFTRLIVHYKLFHEAGTIFIDLNERGKMLLKPKRFMVPHFYGRHIPRFEVRCIHQNEIIAEKVMAACQRYKPRDYFDLYYIIKRNLPLSIGLVRKKFRANNEKFSSYLLFKNTNRIFNKWEDDLSSLTKTLPSFNKVMPVIKKKVKYRE
ncbi:MAG: nucleotidyl transferase AbiEii/AbiGii toxin family protein [Candidatus Nanoarchaeia archaeon]|nr:nucleotidyl transferase AbiEii/AbiGii toxin family protein [Candidatus Nanoarchaeia archaeon]